MIYYIYKINFLKGYPKGRYYLGMRSFGGDDVEQDLYHGSGLFCKEYFSEYEPIINETYTKDVLEYNVDFETNRLREIEIIGDKWKIDPLCMNVIPGGSGGDNCIPQAVIQYDIYGNEIARFPSEVKASEAVGRICSSGISKSCITKTTTCSGYLWRFENDPLLPEELKNIIIRSKPVIQYDISGNFIKLWDSAKEAANYLNMDGSSIIAVCSKRNSHRHTAGGFVWSYYNKDFIYTKSNKTYNYKQKVNKYTLDGTYIATYESFADAARSENTSWQSIQSCCKRQINRVGNYIYRFLNDSVTPEDIIAAKRTIKRKIYKFDENKKLVTIYDELKEAASSVNSVYQSLQKVLKSGNKYKGFYWSYNENCE